MFGKREGWNVFCGTLLWGEEWGELIEGEGGGEGVESLAGRGLGGLYDS